MQAISKALSALKAHIPLAVAGVVLAMAMSFGQNAYTTVRSAVNNATQKVVSSVKSIAASKEVEPFEEVTVS